LVAASPASADRHPEVTLQIDGCDTDSEIRRIVAIELDTNVIATADADRTRATVTCQGSLAVLRIENPTNHESLSRTIDLESAMPKARARLVALAVVELIATSQESGVESPPQTQAPTTELRDAVVVTAPIEHYR